jgi:hypothetical protein
MHRRPDQKKGREKNGKGEEEIGLPFWG